MAESIRGSLQLLRCHTPCSLFPQAAPQQTHCCGTGCVERLRRLGAGSTRLRSKCVNKSIFKQEAVEEGEPPRAGLFCRWQGLARGLEVQVRHSAFSYCFLGGFGGKCHQL